MLLVIISLLILPQLASASCGDLLSFESKKLHSKQTIDFCQSFNNKVLLVVNTASQCGFTPQFKQLESLYQKYKGQGLEIIGFPSNDFRQEHKSEAETASVCFKNYGVSFTMVAPSSVTGAAKNDFYKILTERAGKQPSWNFNKYLVSKDTKSIEHVDSNVSPLNGALEQRIVQLLK